MERPLHCLKCTSTARFANYQTHKHGRLQLKTSDFEACSGSGCVRCQAHEQDLDIKASLVRPPDLDASGGAGAVKASLMRAKGTLTTRDEERDKRLERAE